MKPGTLSLKPYAWNPKPACSPCSILAAWSPGRLDLLIDDEGEDHVMESPRCRKGHVVRSDGSQSKLQHQQRTEVVFEINQLMPSYLSSVKHPFHELTT